MTIVSGTSLPFRETLNTVVEQTRQFLSTDGTSEPSDELLNAVRDYYVTSDLLGAEFAREMATDGRNEVAPRSFFSRQSGSEEAPEVREPRSREQLFWASLGDMLAFRCIGVMEAWAAVQVVRNELDDGELSDVASLLQDDVNEAWEWFSAQDMPRVRGGQVPITDLETSLYESVLTIAKESASNVVGTTLDIFGAGLPRKKANKLVKLLNRVGQILNLDLLLEWAQRLLALALDKLRRLFGPGFDVIFDSVERLVSGILKVRDEVVERLFDARQLRSKCDIELKKIDALEEPERSETLRVCEMNLASVSTNFDSWNHGFDFASECLNWGSRISAITPPIAGALLPLRGTLAVGAYLIGQYHLDSPEFRVKMPWRSHGVLRALSGSSFERTVKRYEL